MIAYILVAVLLSLAGAPVLQADSRSDYCESVRLERAAKEQWAKDAPESEPAKKAVEAARRKKVVACGNPATAARLWHSAATLRLLHRHMEVLRVYADVAQLAGGGGSSRMSVKALLLFVEARIYAIRAFEGLLDEMR